MAALQCIHPTADLQPTISITDDNFTAFKIHPNYWPLVVDTQHTFHVNYHTAPPAQPPAYESRIRLYVELRYPDGMFGDPPPTEITLHPIHGTHSLTTIGNRLTSFLRLSMPLIPFRVVLVSGPGWDGGLTVDQLGLRDMSWLVYNVVPEAVPEVVVNG